MAQDTQNGAGGFVTGSQQSGLKGASGFTKYSNDPQSQQINSLIEYALTKYTKYMQDYALSFIKNYMSASGFRDKKIANTPIDAFSVVNRQYLTANGTTTNRPSSPVLAQPFFDTTLGYMIWFNGSIWVNASGGAV